VSTHPTQPEYKIELNGYMSLNEMIDVLEHMEFTSRDSGMRKIWIDRGARDRLVRELRL
jgi:hypothetical protein